MKKILLILMLSIGMVVSYDTIAAQEAPKVTSDFLYEDDYVLTDTSFFMDGDSLVYGEIEKFENEDGETRLELTVEFGNKKSYYYIFLDGKRMRVAQEKLFADESETPVENVIFYPAGGKGKLRVINYNGSMVENESERKAHLAMIVDFIEDKMGIAIKY
jgi:hypothetical protein